MHKFLLSASLAFSLFVLINIASNNFLRTKQLDLTNNKIYSLSTGSKKIINSIDEPILLRYYFSKKLAKNNIYLKSFANRIEDLLWYYKLVSNNKINVQIIDPEPFSEEEEDAINYGLVNVDNIYFGLVGTNSTAERQIIEFFDINNDNIEYEITRLVHNLIYTSPKIIGLISELPITNWTIYQKMQQQFRIEKLPANINEIPAYIKTLMLVNPNNLSRQAKNAIDDYVNAGGRVLAFIDPHSEVQNQAQTLSLNLTELLAGWGLELLPNKIVAGKDVAKKVIFKQPNNKDKIINYPLWLELMENNFNRQDIVTQNIPLLTMATPGALTIIDNDENITPLITTSDQAMLLDVNKVSKYKNNPENLLEDYKADNQQYILAVRTSNKNNVIVVADTDMLHDHFWLDKKVISGNGNFILNALDNLCGNDDLISIRGKAVFSKPFTKMQQLEYKYQTKYLVLEKRLLGQMQTSNQQLLENTRHKLRKLRREYNQDLDKVDLSLKILSVWTMPVLILFIGFGLWLFRLKRMVRDRISD